MNFASSSDTGIRRKALDVLLGLSVNLLAWVRVVHAHSALTENAAEQMAKEQRASLNRHETTSVFESPAEPVGFSAATTAQLERELGASLKAVSAHRRELQLAMLVDRDQSPRPRSSWNMCASPSC